MTEGRGIARAACSVIRFGMLSRPRSAANRTYDPATHTLFERVRLIVGPGRISRLVGCV